MSIYEREAERLRIEQAMFAPAPPKMVIPIGDMIAQVFSIHQKLGEDTGDYNFLVNNIDDINFKKIADDLSYADPLRIVESGDGKLWAVVHHTIYDKYLRSEMYGTDTIPRQPIHGAIIQGVTLIEPKTIDVLIKNIRKIKQASWTDKNNNGSLIIQVKKVKI